MPRKNQIIGAEIKILIGAADADVASAPFSAPFSAPHLAYRITIACTCSHFSLLISQGKPMIRELNCVTSNSNALQWAFYLQYKNDDIKNKNSVYKKEKV